MTDSGKDQDKTGKIDEPPSAAPSSSFGDSTYWEAKSRAYRAMATELTQKKTHAECFDPLSVCNIACSAC